MNSEGEFRTFSSGAVRDTAKKKPMVQLISPFFLRDLGEWLRFACRDRKPKPYPPRNWERGMPFSETVGSGFRHLLAIMEGDETEDHIAALGFAAMALAHYRHEIEAGRMDPELDDMPKYEQESCPVCGRRVEACMVPFSGKKYDCPACKWTSLDPPPEPEIGSKADALVKELIASADEGQRIMYIAGPMRGIAEFNFPAFDAARDHANRCGIVAISPADLDRAEFSDSLSQGDLQEFENHLTDIVERDTRAILAIARSGNPGGVAALPGWRKSTGAAAEVTLARWLKLSVVSTKDFKSTEEIW